MSRFCIFYHHDSREIGIYEKVEIVLKSKERKKSRGKYFFKDILQYVDGKNCDLWDSKIKF
jgi:hypothetical protein